MYMKKRSENCQEFSNALSCFLASFTPLMAKRKSLLKRSHEKFEVNFFIDLQDLNRSCSEDSPTRLISKM